MNRKGLNVYKVTFEDGTVHKVYGVYASHGWSIAQQLFPNKVIKALELSSSQHTAA